MSKTDKRVLRFFVSSALLAGSAACSKNKSEDTINEGPAEELHVNEGPMVEKPVEETVNEDAMNEKRVEKNVNVGPKTGPDSTDRVPLREPDRVNTNHIGPNGENLNPHGGHPTPPVAVPKKPVEEDRVNTNHIDPNRVDTKPPVPSKEPVSDETNTGRQVEPVPVGPAPLPERTNTNRQVEPSPPPATKL